MKSTWGMAAATLLLAGCSAMTYQEPQSGPRAKVRFSTDTLFISVVRQYDDDRCSDASEKEMMRLRNGALATSTPKRLGIPGWRHHEHAAKEVYIPAGKPFYAMVRSGEITNTSFSAGTVTHTTEHCGVAFSFVFEEGRDYEVAFNHAGCTIRINRFDTAADGAVKVVPQPLGPMDRDECRKAVRKTRLG